MTTLDVVICKFFCLILLIFAKFRCAHFAKINHTANLEMNCNLRIIFHFIIEFSPLFLMKRRSLSL